MELVNLIDICDPKQWKTISSKNLKEDGYPVYGANGIIGYFDKYTHEFPTLLITCRGATCGSLNISLPKSYLNGNAMALDNLSNDYDLKYLYYYLKNRGLDDVISGSAQPQITKENLSRVKVLQLDLEVQKAIAARLDKADEIRQLNQQIINHYDELIQALFIDMFGDPVKNEKGWEKKELKYFGKIYTGNTPSRKVKEYYDQDFIEWIKTDNINSESLYVTNALEYLSEIGSKKGRVVDKGAILIACIAGSIKSIGRCALTNRKVSFNQQINAIQPNSEMNSYFLYNLLKNSSTYIQNFANNGMKKMISKSELEKINFIFPPLKLQNQFAESFIHIEAQKELAVQALQQSEDLFNSLLQQAFKK